MSNHPHLSPLPCACLVLSLAAACSVPAQTVTLDNVPPFNLSTSTTSSAVAIDPVSGHVVVRSAAGNLVSCSASGGAPVINSFTSNPTSVNVNGTFRLSWSSSNTTSCSPQLGGSTLWSSLGTLPSSGFQDLTAPGTAQTITFQLTCTNGSQTVNQQTSLTVTAGGGGGGSCQPPAGYTVSGPTAWTGVFPTPWPSYNAVNRQCISNGQIVSLEFNASSSPTQFGTISTSGFPGDGGGMGRFSISTEPGCFDGNHVPATCIGAIADLPGVSWTNGSSTFVCDLTPGQRYYLNFYFPTCSSGTCCRDMGNIQQLLQEAPPAD